MTHSWFEAVRALTLRLVQMPSVTGTAGEREFARHLYRILAAHPYFQAHPDHLRLERTTDDPQERYNLFALVRGTDRQTVLLSGHYDVVGTGPYGSLAPWAFDPEELLPRLVAELETDGRNESDQLALADLRSGDFLPGRGVLDMKSGLAAGIAVLFRLAEAPSPPAGNLLLLATPDEEDNSHGMRAAAQQLPGLAAAWDLELRAAINLDATNDSGDGSDGRAVFLGSVGKLLPSVYLVGRETHAGRPFDGVNPNLLAAEATRRMECAADLADVAEGEASPPPVTLKQADLKDHYDVTTPGAAWCYYNVLTHRAPAAEVLSRVVNIVREALEAAMDHLREQARRYGHRTGRPGPAPAWKPLVLTFAELKERVLQQSDAAARQRVERLIEQLAADPEVDLRTLSRRVTEALWAMSGLTGPAAVVGFASLYYPPVHLGMETPRRARLRRAACRQAEALARETGLSIRLRPFFPGISDMSFLAGAAPSEDYGAVTANAPAWESRVRFDYQVTRELDLPVINVGPWGRDYHQRTERVHMPYSFGLLPELVWRIVLDLFEEQSGA